jgi:hypothetical protein
MIQLVVSDSLSCSTHLSLFISPFSLLKAITHLQDVCCLKCSFWNGKVILPSDHYPKVLPTYQATAVSLSRGLQWASIRDSNEKNIHHIDVFHDVLQCSLMSSMLDLTHFSQFIYSFASFFSLLIIPFMLSPTWLQMFVLTAEPSWFVCLWADCLIFEV